MLYINGIFGTREEPTPSLAIISAAFTVLKMSNSCANPIIYSRLHHSFRKRIIRFFESKFSLSELIRKDSIQQASSKQKSAAKHNLCSTEISRMKASETIRRKPNLVKSQNQESFCQKLSSEIEDTQRLWREARFSRIHLIKESIL